MAAERVSELLELLDEAFQGPRWHSVLRNLANVAPDLEDDLATGVRGLPHILGPRVSAVLGALLLGGASVVLVLGPPGPPTVAGWAGLALAVPAVVVAALAGTRRFRRLAFPAVMLLTVLDVVLLLVGGASLR